MQTPPETRQGMQALSTGCLLRDGNRPLLAAWVLVGLARVWRWRSHSWETDANVCLCSLALSHENSFRGSDVSGCKTVAKDRQLAGGPHHTPGRGGLAPSWDQLPASGAQSGTGGRTSPSLCSCLEACSEDHIDKRALEEDTGF